MVDVPSRGSTDPNGFLSDLQDQFLDESRLLLDRINENLAVLDQWMRGLDQPTPQRFDGELMNDLFRAAHSIKGLSAMLGLGEINRLADKIEKVFDAARTGKLEVTPETVELLFDALSALTQHIDQIRGAQDATFDDAQLQQRLNALLEQAGLEPASISQQTHPDGNGGVPHSGPIITETRPSEPQAENLAPPMVARGCDVEPPREAYEDSDPDMDFAARFMPLFIDETEPTLDQMIEMLLELEAQPRPKLVEHLLVSAHRLKGSSASLGLNSCAKLAHSMEDVLQAIGDNEIKPTPPVIDALMRCADALRTFVSGLRSGIRDDGHFPTVLRGLQSAFAAAMKAEVAPQPAGPTATEPATSTEASFSGEAPVEAKPTPEPQPENTTLPDWAEPMLALLPPGAAAVAGQAWFPPSMPLPGLKASLILERLGSLGKVFYSNPPASELDHVNELPSFTFGLLTPASAATIASRLKLGGVTKVDLVPLPRLAPPANQPARQEGAADNSAKETSKPSDGTEQASGEPRSVAAEPAVPPQFEPIPATTLVPDTVSTSPDRQPPPSAHMVKPSDTLRVETQRLDQLLNLAGQLAMNKAKIAQIGQTLRNRVGRKRRIAWGSIHGQLRRLVNAAGLQGAKGRRDFASLVQLLHNELQLLESELESLNEVRQMAGELNDVVHQLERIAGGIQRSVMQARMVPVGPLFNRFRRVVRDLARITGKQIRLEISGEKTELDKRTIDELIDPLLHLVRNCADHGIELPEERLRAGKPAEGTISLDAYYRGNSILIHVKDDGRGLDVNRIRAKAVQKGLVSAAEAERLTPEQLTQFIWEPGFSTAAEVTEVSGRGIGVDIVRRKVEELGGTVSMESHQGQGTIFTIRLPLTVAILPCLLVEIEGQSDALPIELVQEIVGYKNLQVTNIHGHRAAVVRDRMVAVVELRELFAHRQVAAPPVTSMPSRDAAVVLLGEPGKELGLRVDRLLGEDDVVVQSLAVNYRHIPGIAGASVLGDGRVSLILDVNALVETAAAPAMTQGN